MSEESFIFGRNDFRRAVLHEHGRQNGRLRMSKVQAAASSALFGSWGTLASAEAIALADQS
jgi:hypothetical protein